MGTAPDERSGGDGGDGVFEWLAHDPAHHGVTPPADDGTVRVDPTPAPEWVTPAPTHARLDPLTVQGVINRALVLVFCLIAVGAAYEAFGALTSGSGPRTTAVNPAPLVAIHVTATSAPRPATKTKPKPTAHPTATTQGPVTTNTTLPPTTVTVSTTPRTTPPTSARTTPPPPAFVSPPATTPPTAPPVQTIQVPATAATTPAGPTDTVVVPFVP